jgi:hypothetical protein
MMGHPNISRNVTLYLNEQFLDRKIGCSGPQKWPPRSPDLSPIVFHVWGYIKNMEYEHKVHKINYFSEYSMLQDASTPQFFVKLYFPYSNESEYTSKLKATLIKVKCVIFLPNCTVN